MQHDFEKPWLVAVWPGMGHISQIAGSFLVHTLGASPVAELPSEDYFEQTAIRVESGLVLPPELPKNVLYGWKSPGSGRDLLLFLGEAQPFRDGLRFCDGLLSLALEKGASRVVTFAAMGTPIRPEAKPRVFAVATDAELLEEVRAHEVEALAEAQISGLNGVLLSAAGARGMGGICLLGEFPFFASSVANPKASAAVLRVFCELAGVDLDLSPLQPRIDEIEKSLVDHLEALERAAGTAGSSAQEGGELTSGQRRPEREELDPAQRSRLEDMFRAAAQDRSKALELKAELDRLCVFEEYEDRFLDLFKQAD